MELFNFTIRQGSAPVLRFRLLVPENVVDWTTTFYLKDQKERIIFQANGAPSGEVTNAALIGVFDVPLTTIETLALIPKVFSFSFWRTNPGFEDPLVSGECTVKKV